MYNGIACGHRGIAPGAQF